MIAMKIIGRFILFGLFSKIQGNITNYLFTEYIQAHYLGVPIAVFIQKTDNSSARTYEKIFSSSHNSSAYKHRQQTNQPPRRI